jgi:hypothetical protein
MIDAPDVPLSLHNGEVVGAEKLDYDQPNRPSKKSEWGEVVGGFEGDEGSNDGSGEDADCRKQRQSLNSRRKQGPAYRRTT